MTERATLLQRIQAYSFALVDLGMYLDTHPYDKNALACFEKYNVIQQQLNAEFSAKYGPLTMQEADTSERWNWVDDPWPWERAYGGME